MRSLVCLTTCHCGSLECTERDLEHHKRKLLLAEEDTKALYTSTRDRKSKGSGSDRTASHDSSGTSHSASSEGPSHSRKHPTLRRARPQPRREVPRATTEGQHGTAVILSPPRKPVRHNEGSPPLPGPATVPPTPFTTPQPAGGPRRRKAQQKRPHTATSPTLSSPSRVCDPEDPEAPTNKGFFATLSAAAASHGFWLPAVQDSPFLTPSRAPKAVDVIKSPRVPNHLGFALLLAVLAPLYGIAPLPAWMRKRADERPKDQILVAMFILVLLGVLCFLLLTLVLWWHR